MFTFCSYFFGWKPIQDQHKNPQHQSKKVEAQKVIIKSEGDDIKDAFELFDANDGKINAMEIRTAMQNIGFDEKNKVFMKLWLN